MTTTHRNPELQQILEAIQSRQRFVLSSHARPDGDSIGSQMAMAFALRALGKQVHLVNSDQASGPLLQFPGVPSIEIADAVEGDFDAAIIMECGDLARTGVACLDRYFVINIDHHPGNTEYGQINWFDSVGGRLRRNGVRPDARPGRAAVARDGDAHLSRHSHRHRVVSLLETSAAPSRSRGERIEAGVDPVRMVARSVRQQQHGPAEAVRRRSERHADRRHRPYRHRLRRSPDGARGRRHL